MRFHKFSFCIIPGFMCHVQLEGEYIIWESICKLPTFYEVKNGQKLSSVGTLKQFRIP